MKNLGSLDKLFKSNPQWISSFREKKNDEYNKLEVPKWKRIRLDGFEIPEYNNYNKEYVNSVENEDIIASDIRNINDNLDVVKDYLYIDDNFGVGEKFVTLAEALYNSGVVVIGKRNKKNSKPINIVYEMDSENSLVIDHNIIVGEENSEMTVVIDYTTLDKTKAMHNGVTKVFAKDNSVVNVIKIQRMNDFSNHFDSNIAFVKGYGKVNWITVEIGSKISATNFITNLNGDNSESELYSVYFGDKDRKIDIGYTMNHKGIRTLSNIDCKGALKDTSKKVFRGNLDFKSGSKRSKGSEQEYVLLLDKTVKSDAIPALLCDEHDVEGEHAASAGQINENQLYYLMSRGFDENEAKKLIVEASFRPIIDKIPDEKIREVIIEDIHRRLIND